MSEILKLAEQMQKQSKLQAATIESEVTSELAKLKNAIHSATTKSHAEILSDIREQQKDLQRNWKRTHLFWPALATISLMVSVSGVLWVWNYSLAEEAAALSTKIENYKQINQTSLQIVRDKDGKTFLIVPPNTKVGKPFTNERIEGNIHQIWEQ